MSRAKQVHESLAGLQPWKQQEREGFLEEKELESEVLIGSKVEKKFSGRGEANRTAPIWVGHVGRRNEWVNVCGDDSSPKHINCAFSWNKPLVSFTSLSLRFLIYKIGVNPIYHHRLNHHISKCIKC